jgi:hypothetical protein
VWEDELIEVNETDASFLNGGGFQTDSFHALVPISDQVMACVHRVSPVLLKTVDVVENVRGFQSVHVTGNPREGLPRFELIHACKLVPLSFNCLLFLSDVFQ